MAAALLLMSIADRSIDPCGVEADDGDHLCSIVCGERAWDITRDSNSGHQLIQNT